ncbi:MAG TPA: carboxy terminal-processing peptidase [Steroidobacteraceae bacterium]|nr:carboxy terminal-processing peptidase [Steroidobacteraceae bacterium]
MTARLRSTLSPRLRLLIAALAAACVLALVGSGAHRAPLAPALAASGDLAPSDRHRRVMRLVSEVVERQHYRQAALDDDMSAQIYERYLEALDGSRSYLLASDIAEFERLRHELDDAIGDADAGPAFEIFARYRERNREVLRHAIALLDVEPDFTLDESFRFDRSEEGWPASEVELKELWRKRVKNDGLSLVLAGKSWPEAADILRKRYERVAKRVEQITADDVFETFMNAYSHVYDPHSNYLSPRNSEEYNIAMSLSYEGIGASLQLVDDHVTIMNVLPGGSAAASTDVKVGDRITAVGQGEAGPLTDVVGWRLDDVVQLIRGPANSTVRLQILAAGANPGSQEAQIALKRSKITLESQAAKKEIHTLQRGDRALRVGVISVQSFYQDFQARVAGEPEYRSTTRDVRRLIEELRAEDIDSLVVDLRDNGGGHLSEATSLVGLFVERGPVVQLRETGGRIEVLDDPEPGVAWSGPLVVLVNRASASASEIFAGAIQDYQRGLVVGQQTYGKGSVQNLYPLDRYALGPKAGFGQLTVTIGKYYRVTGDSTQHRGVEPDITLPSLLSTEDVGESTRDSALPWDRINAARFTPEPAEAPVISLLSKVHERRIASNPDFVALMADVEALERLRSQREVSLNLQQRRAERDAEDAERLARENARRVARGLEPLADIGALDAAEAPDAVLDEAVEIAADAAELPKTAEPARLS